MPVFGNSLIYIPRPRSAFIPWNTLVAANTPYLWYKMDESSGNAINYGTQASVDLTPTGGLSRQVTGQVGATSATGFLGGGYFANNSTNPTYALTGTIHIVIKPLATWDNHWLFGWSNGFDSDQIAMQGAANGMVRMFVANADTNEYTRNTTTLPINYNSWNLISVVKPSGSNKPLIYINGVKETSYADGSGSTPDSYWISNMGQRHFTLGARPETNPTTNPFVGNIDEFVYYNGVSNTDQQVLQHYNSLGTISNGSFATYEDYIAQTFIIPHKFKFNENTATTNITNEGLNGKVITGNFSLASSSTMSNQSVAGNADALQLGMKFDSAAGNNLNFNGSNNFTNNVVMGDIGAWLWVIKPDSTSPANDNFMMDAVQSVNTTYRVGMWQRAGGNILTILDKQTNGGIQWNRTYNVQPSIKNDKWHFVAIVQRGDGNGPQLYTDGVNYSSSVTDTTAGATPGNPNGWTNSQITNSGVYSNAIASVFLGAAGRTQGTQPWKGFMDSFAWVEGNVTAQQINDMNNLLALNQSNFNSLISAKSPTHWWKFLELVSPWSDSGSSPVTLTLTGTAPGLLGAPGYHNSAMDWSTSSSNFATGTAGTGLGSSTTGSVVVWVKQTGGGGLTNQTFLAHSNSVDEKNTLAFGVNPQGTGTADRMGACMMTNSLTDRRNWIGSTNLSTFNNGNWHMLAWVQDGSSSMKLYYDGVAETVSETTNGSPPASTAWTSAITDGNSRIVLANSRVATASGNSSAHIASVWTTTAVLTPSEIAAMYAAR